MGTHSSQTNVLFFCLITRRKDVGAFLCLYKCSASTITSVNCRRLLSACKQLEFELNLISMRVHESYDLVNENVLPYQSDFLFFFFGTPLITRNGLLIITPWNYTTPQLKFLLLCHISDCHGFLFLFFY